MRTLKANVETFWWEPIGKNPTAFNEDADNYRADVSTTLSSTLDTTSVDPFRQGTEIRTWKHWSKGTVKIHSGEPAHGSIVENFGLRDVSLRGRIFSDRGDADPVTFISASSDFSHRTSYLLPSVPPVRLNRVEATMHLIDGAIDPVDVRVINSCYGGDVPYEARGVRGAVMAGTSDYRGRSDLVVSYIEPVTSGSFPAFKDSPAEYGKRWPETRFERDVSLIKPFVDRRIYLGEEEGPSNAEIAAVVNVATGSGDFLPAGCRASTSGWVYDDGVGTDSIAFGGLTY